MPINKKEGGDPSRLGGIAINACHDGGPAIARVLQYSAVLPVVENSQYRTNAVGTNRNLFYIHAEVLANKKEAPTPLRS